MVIYEVTMETHCNDEWNTSYYAYPLYESLKTFSTREKAEEYIQNYQCNTIHTLFNGSFDAKEIECNGYQREFIADDEYYNYFSCLLSINEIEVE